MLSSLGLLFDTMSVVSLVKHGLESHERQQKRV